jgi:hypothetical protein
MQLTRPAPCEQLVHAPCDPSQDPRHIWGFGRLERDEARPVAAGSRGRHKDPVRHEGVEVRRERQDKSGTLLRARGDQLVLLRGSLAAAAGSPRSLAAADIV